MTAIDLITSLSLLVEGRCQLSFARDLSGTMKRRGGGMTSKGDGLLRSNLPLRDTILRGASYFVTGQVSHASSHLHAVRVRVSRNRSSPFNGGSEARCGRIFFLDEVRELSRQTMEN